VFNFEVAEEIADFDAKKRGLLNNLITAENTFFIGGIFLL